MDSNKVNEKIKLKVKAPYRWTKDEKDLLDQTAKSVARYTKTICEFNKKKRTFEIFGETAPVKDAEWLVSKKMREIIEKKKKKPDITSFGDSSTEDSKEESNLIDDVDFAFNENEEGFSYHNQQNDQQEINEFSKCNNIVDLISSDESYIQDSNSRSESSLKKEYKLPCRVPDLKKFFISTFGENILHILVEQTQAEFEVLDNSTIAVFSDDENVIELGYNRLKHFVENKLAVQFIHKPVSLFHYPIFSVEQKIFFASFPQLIDDTMHLIDLQGPYFIKKIAACNGHRLYVPLPAVPLENNKGYILPGGMEYPDILSHRVPPVNRFIPREKLPFQPPHVGFTSSPQYQNSRIQNNYENRKVKTSNQSTIHISWQSVLDESSSDEFSPDFEYDLSDNSNSDRFNRDNLNTQRTSYFIDKNGRKFYNSDRYQAGEDDQNQLVQQKPPGILRKRFNWSRVVHELERGLKEVNSHRGEVELKIKFGKLLYLFPNEKATKRLWQYTDINEIAINELKARAFFLNCLFENAVHVQNLKNFLSGVVLSRKVFEINALMRQINNGPMIPVKMYVNFFNMTIEKIVCSKRNHSVINWCSLDRKVDFQISLSTRCLIPIKLKWIKKFFNNFSCSPKDHSIAFKNFPGSVEVKSVKLKSREGFNLTENTGCRIEKVELYNLVSEDNTISGYLDTQDSTSYYQLEVYHKDWPKYFLNNCKLEIGELAQWQPPHILGQNLDKSKLLETLKTAIRMVEQIDKDIQ